MNRFMGVAVWCVASAEREANWPGLVNRAARYLEAAAILVHQGVLPADFTTAQIVALSTADIAALAGPSHGGANERVCQAGCIGA